MVDIDFGKKSKKIKVALVDDHALFREGLRLVLDQYEGLKIIYEAINGKELFEKLVNGEPDVIFMDINMPDMDGLETTKRLRVHFPQIKIVILTMHDEKRFIIEMIKNGANGYLFKNVTPDELYTSIKNVIEEGFYFNEFMTKELHAGWSNRMGTAKLLKKVQKLSQRDVTVLRLICQQNSSEQIGEKLRLSARTVDNIRSQLLRRLRVKNTAGLVLYAIQNGLVNLNISTRRKVTR